MDDDSGKKLYTPHDRNEGVWIEHDDSLYCAAYSSVASLTVSFAGYFRKANGEILRYEIDVNPTSDRAVTATQQVFGAGFLLSCAAYLKSGNANRGQCYVRAGIRKGSGTPLVVLNQIVGGYVTDEFSPSFPFGTIAGPLEGPGYQYTTYPADPAAGANFAAFVPDGATWLVHTVRTSFNADGTAANRVILVDLQDDTNAFARMMSTAAITAAQGGLVTFGLGLVAARNTTTLAETIALPEVRLPAEGAIFLQAANLQATDQFSNLSYRVEEWIEA